MTAPAPAPRGGTPGAILRTLRPHQWVKNLFVVAPLVFAQHASFASDLARTALAFLVFSALSGCVYLLNDLLDAEADRVHPVKRHRPIASGALAPAVAQRALVGLLVAALGTAFVLSPGLAAVGLGYFALNVAYSTSLKHIAFVDVLSIAAGFILRVYGGAVVIDVPLSHWLFLCTFLLATYLGLGKRKHELVAAGDDAVYQRRVLEQYDLAHITHAMTALAVATVASYTAYSLFGHTQSSFDPRSLVWTIPSVLFGLWRFQKLADRTDDGHSPTDLLLRDAPFLANGAVWAAIVVVALYL